MPERGFLVMETGGRRLTVPADMIRKLVPWEPPQRVPGAAPWVDGLLPGEGEVWPTVRESHLGPAIGAPEVYALVRRAGKILAVPGRKPRLLTASAGNGIGRETGEAEAERFPSLDLDGLYMALGLQ